MTTVTERQRQTHREGRTDRQTDNISVAILRFALYLLLNK